jgi:hypothetical protein
VSGAGGIGRIDCVLIWTSLPLKTSAVSLVWHSRPQKSKFGVVIGLAFGPLVAEEILCSSFCFLMYKHPCKFTHNAAIMPIHWQISQ